MAAESTDTLNGYDLTLSNLILMVGGQILIIIIVIMIVWFGMPPISFPANKVRNIISRTNS